jgi:hypothetical protein
MGNPLLLRAFLLVALGGAVPFGGVSICLCRVPVWVVFENLSS